VTDLEDEHNITVALQLRIILENQPTLPTQVQWHHLGAVRKGHLPTDPPEEIEELRIHSQRIIPIEDMGDTIQMGPVVQHSSASDIEFRDGDHDCLTLLIKWIHLDSYGKKAGSRKKKKK